MAGRPEWVCPTGRRRPFPCSSGKEKRKSGGKAFCLNGEALLLIKSSAEASAKIELELHDHV